jgi:hypothetical protein
MCAVDGSDSAGAVIVGFGEELCGREQIPIGVEPLVARDFPSELPPQHLNGIEPRTVGRQVQQRETAGGSPQHRVNLLVLMRGGVVPYDVHGPESASPAAISADRHRCGVMYAAIPSQPQEELGGR